MTRTGTRKAKCAHVIAKITDAKGKATNNATQPPQTAPIEKNTTRICFRFVVRAKTDVPTRNLVLQEKSGFPMSYSLVGFAKESRLSRYARTAI